MGNINKLIMERIIKCVVAYNQGQVDFDKKFLELYDNTDLIVEDKGEHILLKIVFRRN